MKITNEQLKKVAPNYWMPKKEMLKYNENCKAYVYGEGHLEATSYGHWATSYGHWAIVTNKNGLYFFNWYSFSNTTRKHQHKISQLVRDLGINYITVRYHDDIRRIDIHTMLRDKINSLYTRENDLSVSKARKYAVYSESEFNDLLSDIKTIAAACKIPESKLNEMLLDAELKATESMFNKLCDKLELDNTRKELAVKIESLESITL